MGRRIGTHRFLPFAARLVRPCPPRRALQRPWADSALRGYQNAGRPPTGTRPCHCHEPAKALAAAALTAGPDRGEQEGKAGGRRPRCASTSPSSDGRQRRRLKFERTPSKTSFTASHDFEHSRHLVCGLAAEAASGRRGSRHTTSRVLLPAVVERPLASSSAICPRSKAHYFEPRGPK